MLKRYKNYSKGINNGLLGPAGSASMLSLRTAARATFAPDEGLWILRVRRVDRLETRSQHYTSILEKICPIEPDHL